jgi:predicted  nucleic acid-binding Zn-ribbon protein
MIYVLLGSFMKKLAVFMLVGCLFTANSYAETIQDLVDDIKDIQDKIKSLSSSDTDEANIIDQSIEEINKATNFALEKIESEDLESAKAALAYSSKSIGDVGKVVPKEFESDMSNADIESFAPEKMETLKIITTAMAEKKQEDSNLLLDQIINLNEAGFNTTAMSGNLASLGIDTVTMIELSNRKFSKIKNEIIENQSEISKTQENLKQLENQMDPLGSQITAIKAKELAPDSILSVKFNYENTKISKDAARVGAISMGKSNTELANSWKGEIETTKIVNGSVIQLSEDEIQSVKADLAMESTIEALATGNISENLAIDSSELNLASALSADVMMETLQQQTKYLSYAVSEGMHEMTTESAMAGVKSLGKSQADWAAAWTGGDPTSKNINGINIALTAQEIQATKAEWAMNRAAQSIMEGETFTGGSLTIDTTEIQKATANAAQQAMADVQEKAADIASQVSSIAESVQNMQQGISAEVGVELAQTITEVVAANSSLASNVAERAIESVAELEEYLNIDVAALTENTSSWTEADWASSWTGDEPGNDPGLGRDYTDAEKQAIKAEWAKNRAEQYGN